MELRQELRSKSKIESWANKYNVANDTCIETLVPEVEQRGHLTKCELIEVSKWVLQNTKGGRRQRTLNYVETNSPDAVREITSDAFLLTDDSDCIRCLTRKLDGRKLHGIGETIGSVILHWFHECRYPTWTPHARWAVQLCQNSWSYKRWQDYVNKYRDIADEYEVCMRTLDRAARECGKANMS